VRYNHRLICSAELSLFFLINCSLTLRPVHEKSISLRTLTSNNTGTQLMFISLFVYDRFAEHDDYRRAADYARLSWNSKHLTCNTKPEILRRNDRQIRQLNLTFPLFQKQRHSIRARERSSTRRSLLRRRHSTRRTPACSPSTTTTFRCARPTTWTCPAPRSASRPTRSRPRHRRSRSPCKCFTSTSTSRPFRRQTWWLKPAAASR